MHIELASDSNSYPFFEKNHRLCSSTPNVVLTLISHYIGNIILFLVLRALTCCCYHVGLSANFPLFVLSGLVHFIILVDRLNFPDVWIARMSGGVIFNFDALCKDVNRSWGWYRSLADIHTYVSDGHCNMMDQWRHHNRHVYTMVTGYSTAYSCSRKQPFSFVTSETFSLMKLFVRPNFWSHCLRFASGITRDGFYSNLVTLVAWSGGVTFRRRLVLRYSLRELGRT